MRRKAYSGRRVNQVDVVALAALRAGQPAWVGVDVGKYELRLVVQWSATEFERPWAAKNPLEIGVVVEKLRQLAQGRDLVIALEPSGSYGDALRQALDDAGLVVHRVSPKASHDHAEIFDGVPSQHDGKDAAVVADLARSGHSTRWPWATRSVWEQELELWADRADTRRRLLQLWAGRLEGGLGRHWPELSQQLKVQSPTVLKTVQQYGGPDRLGADPEAGQRLQRFGRRYLKPERIQEVIDGARASVGVRVTEQDRQRLQEYATLALEARDQLQRAKRMLNKLGRANPILVAMGQVVGPATACVLWVHLGSPQDYHCGAAYVKAMGLNLKERSSGIYQGKTKITKRGFAAVRAWMYLAALRWSRQPEVRPWYQQKKQKDQGKGGPGLVGIMRRLGLAVYGVGAKGQGFDPRRLFPRWEKGGCR